ncbi:hypothetical protein AVEN_200022-1, partial [Araneus ventricosus]
KWSSFHVSDNVSIDGITSKPIIRN